MITVLNRPLGHRLTDAELAASVSDSGGDALLTTGFAHSLGEGDYVYIISNFDAYNGFKYVYSPTYNTFKLRDSEEGAIVPYKQSTDLLYRISVLQHGWSAVNQPIVYELESDLYPNNIDEEAYTPNTVVSQADSEGYTLLNLSAALSDPIALSWIEIVGTGDLAGQYQIISAPQPWQIVINLDYDSTNSFSGYQIVRFYKNYCINVNVYAGLDPAHPWGSEKPYELAETLQFIPDINGQAKFSIAELLRGYINTRNNLTLDTLPNNLDFMVQFYIETFESYDSSNGIEIGTFESEPVIDTFQGYAVNASMPFKSLYQSFMSEYVNEDVYLAKWLSIQDQPVTIVGYFFDLSFINTLAAGDISIVINGVVSSTLTNPAIGVIRIPFEFLTAGEYCIQLYNSIGGSISNLDFANEPGADVDWTTGASPSVTIVGSNDSDILWAAYAFVIGQPYTVIINYNSSAVTVGHQISVSITDNSFVTQFSNGVDVIGSGNLNTNPINFTATVDTTRIAIRVSGGGFGGTTVTINQVGTSDIGEEITEEICVTVLEECDDSIIPEVDDIRLLEDGDYRLLE